MPVSALEPGRGSIHCHGTVKRARCSAGELEATRLAGIIWSLALLSYFRTSVANLKQAGFDRTVMYELEEWIIVARARKQAFCELLTYRRKKASKAVDVV